jgi:hypothetical protein
MLFGPCGEGVARSGIAEDAGRDEKTLGRIVPESHDGSLILDPRYRVPCHARLKRALFDHDSGVVEAAIEGNLRTLCVPERAPKHAVRARKDADQHPQIADGKSQLGGQHGGYGQATAIIGDPDRYEDAGKSEQRNASGKTAVSIAFLISEEVPPKYRGFVFIYLENVTGAFLICRLVQVFPPMVWPKLDDCGRHGAASSARVVGSEAYCAICASDEGGGIRSAIPPYALKEFLNKSMNEFCSYLISIE